MSRQQITPDASRRGSLTQGGRHAEGLAQGPAGHGAGGTPRNGLAGLTAHACPVSQKVDVLYDSCLASRLPRERSLRRPFSPHPPPLGRRPGLRHAYLPKLAGLSLHMWGPLAVSCWAGDLPAVIGR